MMTYNFLSPAGDVQNIERLRAAGVGIIPMKTLGGGISDDRHRDAGGNSPLDSRRPLAVAPQCRR